MSLALGRIALSAALLPLLAGCGVGGHPAAAGTSPDWINRQAHVVSEIDVHEGIVAFTGLVGAHRLRTVVVDKTTGERLWSHPAAMAGRPPRLGVGPPAIVSGHGGTIVVAVEPAAPTGTALVARRARSGEVRWRRPVHTSYGPRRCGPYICVSDDHYLYLRSPESGEIRWRAAGPATVASSSAGSAVLFRWGGGRPALQRRDLDTGEVLWEIPLARILGPGVDANGGWGFSRIVDVLVGHVGPVRGSDGRVSRYGFFALRLSDGALIWRRERLHTVRPSPPPESMLLAQRGHGGYMVVAPRTGQLTGQAPGVRRPGRDARIAVSADMELLGFYRPGGKGRAFALDSGLPVDIGDPDATRMWTYCHRRPPRLELRGSGAYHSIDPLCPVDLSTGRKLTGSGLLPPEWYSGRVAGWRVWPGPQGVLYGEQVGYGDSPGVYLIGAG